VRVGATLVDARFDPKEPALWVSVAAPPSMVRIPLREFLLHSRIPLSSTPVSFDVANWEARLAASLSGGGVALVDQSGTAETKVLRGTEQFGLVRFRSDGRQLLAANHSERSISVMRAADAVSLVDLPI